MKLGKFKHLLASALLCLPLVFSGAQAVSAADTTEPTSYDIQLHKLAFDEGKTPDPKIQNTGKEMNIPNSKPLNGVEFTVTDVTDAYTALEGSSEERQTEIQSDANNFAAKGTTVDTQVTKGEGTADFTLNTKNTDGKYAVYLIRETKSNTSTDNDGRTVTKTADPIVLIMPLQTETGNNGKVNLYPKNETKDTLSKDLTDADKAKSGVDNDGNAVNGNAVKGFGDTAEYQVDVTIPSDVASLNQYILTDTPDAGLDITKNSLKLTDADGKELDSSFYGVAATDATADNGAGFNLTFNNTALADAGYAGKTLKLTYSAKITKLLTPGETLNNDVTTPNTPTPITSKTPVTTGGAKFVKVDSTDGKKLAGAVFALAKIEGKKTLYAHKTDTGYDWTEDATDAVTATSDDNGAFEFTGLQYSETERNNDRDFVSYAVVEVTAPDNYAKLSEPQKFNVDKDSYSGDDNTIATVADSPEGFLPSTGGKGIYIVIAAGLLVMAGAFMVLKRGNRREEV